MIEPTMGQLRLVALILFALSMLSLALYVRRRRYVARTIGDPEVIRQLLGTDLATTPWLRLITVAAATAAVAAALLDPDVATERAPPRGPVVLLLDASGSMLVEDVGGQRLDLQRSLARGLIDEIPATPVGIVAFAGRAFSLTPPTRDLAAVDMYLTALDPTIVTQSGSALGAAIRQGISLLRADGSPTGGHLVLFSDGDETEDGAAALEAASLARREHLRVHVVGVGTAAGGLVPAIDLTTGAADGYLGDLAGDPVASHLDDELLGEIARRGGGVYVPALGADATSSLRDAVARVDTPAETPSRRVPAHVWLLGAAFAILLIEPLTDVNRRSR